eukprot:CAMPEP_0117478288 /NCGR_PEP_ID=MMETSP0784-20121206/11267_1 /TAXON_ID=39447 /ORGANISM="" /LENGTH=194 /DNA_ID=CAMNT_0005272629 /DNA_START=245 /DNA_END=827 /DNA_ORIENTATION=+
MEMDSLERYLPACDEIRSEASRPGRQSDAGRTAHSCSRKFTQNRMQCFLGLVVLLDAVLLAVSNAVWRVSRRDIETDGPETIPGAPQPGLLLIQNKSSCAPTPKRKTHCGFAIHDALEEQPPAVPTAPCGPTCHLPCCGGKYDASAGNGLSKEKALKSRSTSNHLKQNSSSASDCDVVQLTASFGTPTMAEAIG